MIWATEWRIALRTRRLFAFNVLVPLGLVAPIALSNAPRAHAAMVYTLVVAFFGTFGSAIPLVRDAESGLFGRIVLGGVSERRLFAERTTAAAAIDALQLLPAMIVISVAKDASPSATLALLLAATIALLFANTLGVWIACTARSIAEAALFATLVTLFAVHFAGVFRAPAPDSMLGAIAAAIPFHALRDAMRVASGAQAAAPPWASIAIAATSAAAALAVTTAAARSLARALARAPQ